MEAMETITMIMGVLGILTYLSELASLDEWKRILKDKKECLNAKILDGKGQISSTPVQRSKKRKRDDALRCWMDEGQKLVDKVQSWLRDAGSWRCYLLGAKMRWDAYKLDSALRLHDIKGDILLKQALFDSQGSCCGRLLPVKQVVGRVASQTLDRLKVMLGGAEVGRIAIHGIEGIGKTFLMKHLHNCALDWFDNVFWVSSPNEFTINCVQDAVAAVVNCIFDSDDDLKERAKKLLQTLTGLGRFALFLDGVPEADFSLEDIGIPISAEGSKCKLVVSTNSTLVCRKLRSFVTVKVEHLPSEEAYQLFMHEARIGEGYVSILNDMARLLADTCGGLPHKIVHLGNCMSGKDDPHEWRDALFQSRCLGTKNKHPIIPEPEPEPERESKRLKKDVIPSRLIMGGSGTSSSAHRPG